MEAFRDGLFDCDLTDLGFTGERFTWSNQRLEPSTIKCRLDRFCGDSIWREFAPHAQIQHLTFSGSDHLKIILRLRCRVQGREGRRRRPCRFNAHWMLKEECEKVVRDGWESVMDPDCFDRLFGALRRVNWGFASGLGMFITTLGNALNSSMTSYIIIPLHHKRSRPELKGRP